MFSKYSSKTPSYKIKVSVNRLTDKFCPHAQNPALENLLCLLYLGDLTQHTDYIISQTKFGSKYYFLI